MLALVATIGPGSGASIPCPCHLDSIVVFFAGHLSSVSLWTLDTFKTRRDANVIARFFMPFLHDLWDW